MAIWGYRATLTNQLVSRRLARNIWDSLFDHLFQLKVGVEQLV